MTEMYAFSPKFEKAVLHHCLTSKTIFLTYFDHIDEDMMASKEGKTVYNAAASIFRDLNDAPGNPVMVEQRIQALLGQGKLDKETALRAMYYLDDIAFEPPPVESVLPELTELLKGKARFNIVDEVAKLVSAGLPLGEVQEMIARAESIGGAGVDVSWGMFGAGMFDRFAQAKSLDRLSSGISELDVYLSGGIPRRTLAVMIGGSGSGKSFFLNEVIVAAMMQGKQGVYITLENPQLYCEARMVAPILRAPFDDILKDPGAYKFHYEEWRRVNPNCPLPLTIQFSPGTTVQAVRDQYTKICRIAGITPEIVCFDYIGEATSHSVNNGQKGSSFVGYAMGGAVATELRKWAEEEDLWMVSAAQSRRKQTPGKTSRLTLDDIADSMNVVRVSDMILTLNYKEDEAGTRSVCIGVPKNRMGRSGDHTSERQAQYAYGLVYPNDYFPLHETIADISNSSAHTRMN